MFPLFHVTSYSRLLIDAIISRDSSYLFLSVGIWTSGNNQAQLKVTITMGRNYYAITDCHNTAVYRYERLQILKIYVSLFK
jgi:hypothetical protein